MQSIFRLLVLCLWWTQLISAGNYREISGSPADDLAAITLYSKGATQTGRGELACHIQGEESFQRANLRLLVNDEIVYSTSQSNLPRLSDVLATPDTVRVFQHSTFSCIRVEIPSGVSIPENSNIRVIASLRPPKGDAEEISDSDDEEEEAHQRNEMSLRGSINLASQQGSVTVVMTQSVQPEDALHRFDYEMDNVVTTPDVKILIDPKNGDPEARLTNNAVAHVIEFLVPSSQFDLWVPAQIKDITYNTIRLYMPKQTTAIELRSWNVSWAIPGAKEYSTPVLARPGDDVVVDGLEPDTSYMFKCCAMHYDGDADECVVIPARTLSYTGSSSDLYESVGIPETFPREIGDGIEVVIPNHRTPLSPQVESAVVTIFDLLTGDELYSQRFEETGHHIVSGFESSGGYRAVISTTDVEKNTFQNEEVIKNAPRPPGGIIQRERGEPRVIRISPKSLALDVPPIIGGLSESRVSRIETEVRDALTKVLYRQQEWKTPGVKYLTNLPDGSWRVKTTIYTSDKNHYDYVNIMNPVLAGEEGDSYDITTKIVRDSNLHVFVPFRLSVDSPKIVESIITVTNAFNTSHVLKKSVTPGSATVFTNIASDTSFEIDVVTVDESMSRVLTRSLIHRSVGAMIPLEPSSYTYPYLTAATPSQFTLVVPAKFTRTDIPNIQETRVTITSAIDGKILRELTTSGASTITVTSLDSTTPFNIRLSVLRGPIQISRKFWTEDVFNFAPRPSGLPLFAPNGRFEVFITSHSVRTVKGKSVSQRVTVRIPSNPVELSGSGSIGRVDAIVLATSINETGGLNQTVLMQYIGAEIGDTLIENLPSPTECRIDVILKVWSEASIKARVPLYQELQDARESRKSEQSATTESSPPKRIVMFQRGSYHVSNWRPKYDPEDGSFDLTFNSTLSGSGRFSKLFLASQFVGVEVNRPLAPHPQFGGAVVVPTKNGVIIRLSSYFCESCGLITSAQVTVTETQGSNTAQCRGASVASLKMAAYAESFIPLPDTTNIDICILFIDVNNNKQKMFWNIPAVKFNSVSGTGVNVGLPRVLPLGENSILARVPLVLEIQEKENGIGSQTNELADELSQMMNPSTPTLKTLQVTRATITVTDTTTNTVINILSSTIPGDHEIPLSGPVASGNLQIRFDVSGKNSNGVSEMYRMSISVVQQNVLVQGSVPPLPVKGTPRTFCSVVDGKVMMSMQIPALFANDTQKVQRVSYTVTRPGKSDSIITEGILEAGGHMIQLPSSVKSNDHVNVTYDVTTSTGQRVVITNPKCSAVGFAPLGGSGSPFISSTTGGKLIVRVPSKLLPTLSPILEVKMAVMRCGENVTLWSNDAANGGDFIVPEDSIASNPFGCFRAQVNVSDETSVKPYQFESSVVAIPRLLPTLPLEGEIELIPLGEGSYILRCPSHPLPSNSAPLSTSTTPPLIELTVEDDTGRLLLTKSVKRGYDHLVSVPRCWKAVGCDFKIREGAHVDKAHVHTTKLSNIPGPSEPDTWTPSSSMITIYNPINQELRVTVTDTTQGRIIENRRLEKAGNFDVKGLMASTTYVVKMVYQDNQKFVTKQLTLKTPHTSHNETSHRSQPLPLSIVPSSTSILVQAPELTKGEKTTQIQVTVQQILTNQTDAEEPSRKIQKILKHPFVGETMEVSNLIPNQLYRVEVISTNIDNNNEIHTTTINTTLATGLLGSANYVIREKSSGSFEIHASATAVKSVLIAFENIDSKIPKELYRGVSREMRIPVSSLLAGTRYRIGVSELTYNMEYRESCAWVTMDSAILDVPLPQIASVTNDQVYITLPPLENLRDYTVKRIHKDPVTNRELRRVSLYQGKGEQFMGPEAKIPVFIARLLAENSVYEFAVQATYKDETTEEPVILRAFTDSSFLTCDIGRPVTPSQAVLAPNTNKNRKFQIAWSFVEKSLGPSPDAYPVQSYAIQLKTLGPRNAFSLTAKWEPYHLNVSNRINSQYVTDVVPGYTYQLRVSAKNFWGIGSYGQPLEVIVPEEIPEPVQFWNITSITESTAVLFWKPSYDNGDAIRSYVVECVPGSGLLSEYPSDLLTSKKWKTMYKGDGNSRSVQLSNLVPATTYMCRVRASNTWGSSAVAEYSYVRFATATSKSEMVPVMWVEKFVNQSVLIGFEKPRHNGLPILGYRAAVLRPGKGFEILPATIETSPFSIHHIIDGSHYTVKIQAISCKGPSQWSPAFKFQAPPKTPTAPRLLALTYVSDTVAAIDWEAPGVFGSPILGYVLECDNGATCLTPEDWTRGPPCAHENMGVAKTNREALDDSLFRKVWEGVKDSTVLNDLIPASTYRCRVFAKNAEGISPPSHIIYIRTSDTVPEAPQELSGTFASNTLTLSWSVPAPNGRPITEYSVSMQMRERAASSTGLRVPDTMTGGSGFESWIQISETGLQATSISIDLQSDRFYSFRVAAVNSVGSSEFSYKSVKSLPSLPLKPQPVSVTKAATSAVLSCPLVDDSGVEVNVYVFMVAKGQVDAKLADIAQYEVVYQGPNSQVEISNLKPGTFLAKCFVSNSIGDSPASEPAMFTFGSGPPDQPLQPSPRSGEYSTPTELYIMYRLPDGNQKNFLTCDVEVAGSWSWDAPSFSSSLTPSESRIFSQSGFDASKSEYSFDATDLLSNHWYSFRVRCGNVNGESTWSPALYLRTKSNVPEKPLAPAMIGGVRGNGIMLALSTQEGDGSPLTSTKVEVECVSGKCDSSFCTSLDSDGLCVTPKSREFCNSVCSSTSFTSQCDVCVIDDLSPGTQYRVKSYVENARGWSVGGNSGLFSTAPDVPSVPENVTIIFNSPNAAVVSWTESLSRGSPINGYSIKYWCKNSLLTACMVQRSELVASSTNSVLIGLLVPGQQYTFEIVAVSNTGISETSTVENIRAPASVADVISAPIVDWYDSSNATIKWEMPALNGATNVLFTIEASTPSNPTPTITTTTQLQTTISNLDLRFSHTFRVKATNYGGFCSLVGARCGEGVWSQMSLPTVPVKTVCPIGFQNSPVECSGRGTCESGKCLCLGNSFGPACEYTTTVGVCSVAGTTVRPFQEMRFQHIRTGEFVMYSNRVFGDEQIRVVSIPHDNAWNSAISKFGISFQNNLLTVELTGSGCPVVRHNCDNVTLAGEYSNPVSRLVVRGTCSGDEVSVENLETQTLVKCYRFATPESSRGLFSSCHVIPRRISCSDTSNTQCNPFNYENGLCGLEGQSRILPNLQPLRMDPIPASQSMFTCNHLEPTNSDTNLELLELESNRESSIHDFLNHRLMESNTVLGVSETTQSKRVPIPVHVRSPHRVMRGGDDVDDVNAVQMEAMTQQDQFDHSFTVKPIRGASPYLHVTKDEQNESQELIQSPLIPRHRLIENRPEHSKVNREHVELDDVLNVQSALPTTNGTSVTVNSQRSLVVALDVLVTSPQQNVTCPEICSKRVCAKAQESCDGLGTGKSFCIDNMCASDCDWCGTYWKTAGTTYSQRFSDVVSVAMLKLETQLQKAVSANSEVASVDDISICPRFVSGRELWNISPNDRNILSWTPSVVQEFKNTQNATTPV